MADDSVVILASMESVPGGADDMRTALLNASAKSNEEDGCIFYQLLESSDKPGSFMVLEKWRDRDAFKKHQKSAHLAETVQRLQPLFAQAPEFKPWKALD